MRKKFEKAMASIRDSLESWGLPTVFAPRGPAALRVRVNYPLPESGRHLHVGDLSIENDEFVFRYSNAYKSASELPPLPSFPDKDREYRAPELFAFFAARLPPVERHDIQQALERLSVKSNDILRVLGLLAKRGVSNAYEFELANRAA